MLRIVTPLILCLVFTRPLPAQTCKTGILDPRIAAVLRDSIKDLQPGLDRMSIEEAKQRRLATENVFPAGDLNVITITTDSIPVYIFNATHEKDLPAILYFHPGAFVVPLLPFMKQECWRMSRDLSAVVFAVDYRIAPKHKFPAAVMDAYRSFEWVLKEGMTWGADIDKLIVSGMSAGANLSAVLCQKARAAGLADKIKLQVLNCPSLDNKANQSRYPSYEKYATGYFQTRQFIDFAQNAYADASAFSDPSFAPMLTSDLRHLPPAVMIIAEFDIFHDEDELYARRLSDAGVKVWSKCFPGQIHCLVGLGPDAPEIKSITTLVQSAMADSFEK